MAFCLLTVLGELQVEQTMILKFKGLLVPKDKGGIGLTSVLLSTVLRQWTDSTALE